MKNFRVGIVGTRDPKLVEQHEAKLIEYVDTCLSRKSKDHKIVLFFEAEQEGVAKFAELYAMSNGYARVAMSGNNLLKVFPDNVHAVIAFPDSNSDVIYKMIQETRDAGLPLRGYSL